MKWMDIREAFETRQNLLFGKGVEEAMIALAEQKLGLHFSEEYRAYLKSYGIAAYDGHELTGITKSLRVDVTAVTKEAKEKDPRIPVDFYVIEETAVEEMLIWQSSTGEIYCSGPNRSVEKICDSLSEYIRGCHRL